MRRYLFAVLVILVTLSSRAHDLYDGGKWRNHERHQEGKVYDANGKFIGLLAANNGDPGVLLTINGTVTFAAITHWTNGDISSNTPYMPSKFEWSVTNAVGFESADCNGKPVIYPSIVGPRPSVVVREGGEAILYIAGDTNTVPIALHSQLLFTQCSKASATSPWLRAEASYSLTRHHPEPLTLGY